jgi:hypothetical protein
LQEIQIVIMSPEIQTNQIATAYDKNPLKRSNLTYKQRNKRRQYEIHAQ